MTTHDVPVELPTLEVLKKRSSIDRWRSAYVVFWTEVVYRNGEVVSEFDLGSTLYTISQDADKAKLEAREARHKSSTGNGIFKMPRHRGSATDMIQIPSDYYLKLISNGREDREFTTLEQWNDYYARRIANLRYYTVEAADGSVVIMGPVGEYIADFPKGVGNPYRIASLLNSCLAEVQRLEMQCLKEEKLHR